MAPSKPRTGERLNEASVAGQMPPTDANATRQRYQLGCHSGGGETSSKPRRSGGNSYLRIKSKSRSGY